MRLLCNQQFFQWSHFLQIVQKNPIIMLSYKEFDRSGASKPNCLGLPCLLAFKVGETLNSKSVWREKVTCDDVICSI